MHTQEINALKLRIYGDKDNRRQKAEEKEEYSEGYIAPVHKEL